VEPGGAPRELLPASPCRPSWAGTWYLVRQGEVPPRRIRHPRGAGCGEGLSFHVCPLDRYRDLTRLRRARLRVAAHRQRRAARPRQRARKGAPPHRFGPRGRTAHRGPQWRPRGAAKQGSPRHPLRLASRWNSFRRRRSATLERRKARERRGRCVGVSAANVWARDPDVCAPTCAFLGRCGYVTAHRLSPPGRFTLHCGSAAPRGWSRVASWVRALNKCAWPASRQRLERA